ncbi:hypothetical protein BD779DRAFT_1787768 [Infundibulicybe gibba]|nr:hypothetical protein BD779DRAFT_1787768 [Infundibulicybe gibba]
MSTSDFAPGIDDESIDIGTLHACIHRLAITHPAAQEEPRSWILYSALLCRSITSIAPAGRDLIASKQGEAGYLCPREVRLCWAREVALTLARERPTAFWRKADRGDTLFTLASSCNVGTQANSISTSYVGERLSPASATLNARSNAYARHVPALLQSSGFCVLVYRWLIDKARIQTGYLRGPALQCWGATPPRCAKCHADGAVARSLLIVLRVKQKEEEGKFGSSSVVTARFGLGLIFGEQPREEAGYVHSNKKRTQPGVIAEFVRPHLGGTEALSATWISEQASRWSDAHEVGISVRAMGKMKSMVWQNEVSDLTIGDMRMGGRDDRAAEKL